jgi:hypothetical protein
VPSVAVGRGSCIGACDKRREGQDTLGQHLDGGERGVCFVTGESVAGTGERGEV